MVVGDLWLLLVILREILSRSEVEVSIPQLGLATNTLVGKVLELGQTESPVLNGVLVEFLHVCNLVGVPKVGFYDALYRGVVACSNKGAKVFKGHEPVVVSIDVFEPGLNPIGVAETRIVRLHQYLLVGEVSCRLLLRLQGDGGGSGDQGCCDKSSSLHLLKELV